MRGIFAHFRARPQTPETTAVLGWRKSFAAVAALLSVILVGGLVSTAPAFAAGADSMTLTKTLAGEKELSLQDLKPGEEFVYTLDGGCNGNFCADLSVMDQLPAELAGFIFTSVDVRASSPYELTTLGTCTLPVGNSTSTATEDCGLAVKFTEPSPTTDGVVGYPGGESYVITLRFTVPADLPPTWAGQDKKVKNTAVSTSTSTNEESISSSAEITVKVPVTTDVVVGKTWAPATQQYAPGAESAVTLSVQNTSNVAAESLVLQDPTTAAEGAATLDKSNPFSHMDFAGFGDATLPAGATKVTVGVYVFVDGAYTWIEGEPGAEPVLPAGVTASDVAGIRLTYTGENGAQITSKGTAGSAVLNLTQRSTDRDSADALKSSNNVVVANQATGTVTVPDQPAVSKPANATLTITPVSVSGTISKSIAPPKIAATQTAKATIDAANTSNVAVPSLTIADRDYFTKTLTFSGFTQSLNYPTGATSGAVTWYFSDGTTQVVAFESGDNPVAPAAPAGAHLTGFEVTYKGDIAPAAKTVVAFGITPTADDVASGSESRENTATLTIPVAGEDDFTVDDDAPLTVFEPTLAVAIKKAIVPSGPVQPGGYVTTKITGTTGSVEPNADPTLNPRTIVIEDKQREGTPGDFYDAFDPVAVSATDVFAHSTLTVTYFIEGDDTEYELGSLSAQDEPVLFSMAIPAEHRGKVVGMRYTYTSQAEDGFSQGTIVRPSTVYQARDTLRSDDTKSTSVAGGEPSSYKNLASADARAPLGNGTITAPTKTDTATGKIQSFEGTEGDLFASKQWRQENGSPLDVTNPALQSQSGAHAMTRLGWAVTTGGYESVIISDPAADAANPEKTTFNAFNLLSIQATNDDLMRWDKITGVEFYYDGQWNPAQVPGTSWKNASGNFRGYTLTASEREKATGVRLLIAEDTTARENAPAGTTPSAPGSGVSSSAIGATRFVDLIWELRNVKRVSDADDRWVTDETVFNTVEKDKGVIDNTMSMTGTSVTTGERTVTEDDQITLRSSPSGVTVDKSIPTKQVVLPNLTDGERPVFPTYTNTIVAQNLSPARASYIRVSDPAVGGAEATKWNDNPFADARYTSENPFERVNLQRIAFAGLTAGEVDQAKLGTVTLWRLDPSVAGAQPTFETYSIAGAGALTAAQLTNVVGISVLYQGTDPVANGGSIKPSTKLSMTLTTQVREYLRSSATTTQNDKVVAYTVENTAYAQTFDPVLNPEQTAHGEKDASIDLLAGELLIGTSKSVTPSTRVETDKAKPVTVNLNASSVHEGQSSSVASNEVVIEDVRGAGDQEFWNSYSLESLNLKGISFTGGADRVRVDLQVDGTTWVNGTVGTLTGPANSPTLTGAAGGVSAPDVDFATVTGVRYTFTKANGAAFTRAGDHIAWSASTAFTATLLDNYRNDTATPVAIPSNVTNAMTATTARTDIALYASKESESSVPVTVGTGTFRLDVAKAHPGSQHVVEVGDEGAWALTARNSGTGYLNLVEFTDTLPASLEWNSVDPVIKGGMSPGSLPGLTPGISETDFTTTYDEATRVIKIQWNNPAQRMAPGEFFTANLGLSLLPGLGGNDHATNTMNVVTTQSLEQCTNTTNDQGVRFATDAPTSCGTTNYVQPRSGNSINVYKGVKGEVNGELVSGATNINKPAQTCVPNKDGYYVYPCVANTVIGATDEWQLRAVNTGTTAINKMTLIDVLPAVGERSFSASGRGSLYRPVLDGAAGLTWKSPLPGANAVLQVTTGATDGFSAATADQSKWGDANYGGVSWSDASAYTGDWADVTALRVNFTFATPYGAADGEIKVSFTTVNVPASNSVKAGAPIDLNGRTDAVVAMNNVGVSAVFSNGNSRARTSAVVGVKLATGSMKIVKNVEGPAASYAPASFAADVSCTVPTGARADSGTEGIIFPKNGTVGLVPQGVSDAVGTVLRDIPLGATCSVTEGAESAGETTRSEPVTGIRILGDESVTATTTITNTYAFSTLSVTKTVESAANVAFDSSLTFGFALSCVAAVTGAPVALAAEDETFTLKSGQTHTVAANTIPANATCELTETDAQKANGVTITGADVTASTGPSATTAIPADGTALSVSNSYSAGTLSLQKELTGTGADVYGTGPFFASVSCVYNGQEIFKTENGTESANPNAVVIPEVELTVGQAVPVNVSENTAAIFPVGTLCSVHETKTGGANTTSYEGLDENNVITIVGPQDLVPALFAEGDEVETVGHVTVLVVNDFRVGELNVIKERVGDGVQYIDPAKDVYTAQVSCTWQRDGENPAPSVALPGGGLVTLNAENDFRAQLTGIIVGAVCIVTETEAGYAVSTTYAPNDGTVTILESALPVEPNDSTDPIVPVDEEVVAHAEQIADAPVATVTITNHFDAGSLSISKKADEKVVAIGTDAKYTITVKNTGKLTATDLPVTDTLPSGATFVAAQGGTFADGVITWTIDSLAPGESVELGVTLRYAKDGSYINRASVGTPEGPWAPKPEDPTAEVTVPPAAIVPPGTLPALGADGSLAAGIALLLLLSGAGVLLLRRRSLTSE